VVHKKRRLQGAFSAGIFFLLGVQKFNNGSKVQQWFNAFGFALAFNGCAVQWHFVPFKSSTC